MGGAPGPFGGGGMFGAPQEEAEHDEHHDGEEQEEDEEDEGEGEEEEEEDDALVRAMAGASLAETSAAGWADAPRYAAVYLNTVAEYVPREAQGKVGVSFCASDGLCGATEREGGPATQCEGG